MKCLRWLLLIFLIQHNKLQRHVSIQLTAVRENRYLYYRSIIMLHFLYPCLYQISNGYNHRYTQYLTTNSTHCVWAPVTTALLGEGITFITPCTRHVANPNSSSGFGPERLRFGSGSGSVSGFGFGFGFQVRVRVRVRSLGSGSGSGSGSVFLNHRKTWWIRSYCT